MTAYTAVYEEINHERERDGIEITCFERFERTLQRLGVEDGRTLKQLAEELTRIHMRGVRNVTSAPAARKDAVRRLAETYRLGLLSNFDDSKTGWEIMADTGVKDKFEAIIISADLRLRKPNPKIFERMLAMLNLAAPEVLFVGDTPHHDVGGAKAVGMSAAWISRHALPLPEGCRASRLHHPRPRGTAGRAGDSEVTTRHRDTEGESEVNYVFGTRASVRPNCVSVPRGEISSSRSRG